MSGSFKENKEMRVAELNLYTLNSVYIKMNVSLIQLTTGF